MAPATKAAPGSRAPRLGVALVLLAAVPQLAVYAGHLGSGQFPGSANRPRVETLLRMSENAAAGGPLATVRLPGEPARHSLAVDVVPDLGEPVVLDLLSRALHQPLGEPALGLFNLIVMAVALGGLALAVPHPLRLALLPVYLGLPIVVPLYRSADTIAIHGALAVLAATAAVLGSRPGPWPRAALAGLLVFATHALRSVYGVYAAGALLGAAGLVALRLRRPAALRGAGLALLAALTLQLPWAALLAGRAGDPRVVERGTVASHDVWAMLISGVGWSENRWGIGASDTKVATFLASRAGLPAPPPLMSRETERIARGVYLELWREDPMELLRIYAARVPRGLAEHAFLGGPGAALWLAALAAALGLAWRRRDPDALAAVAGPALVAFALLGQIAVIDPRLIYAWPLTFLTALSLATSLGTLVVIQRRASDLQDTARGSGTRRTEG
jgi:hypothetical protein